MTTARARAAQQAANGGVYAVDNFSGRNESKRVGAAFEAQALEFLQRQRMRLVARNVTCRGLHALRR